jgi:hypothetical protein
MRTPHHEINVLLVTDPKTGQQTALPDIPTNLVVEDTVHYGSIFGAVRIEFNEPDHAHTPSLAHSPFVDASGVEQTVVRDTDPPLVLRNPGIFFCHCFLTPPGKPEIGWGPNSPLSGGDHVVRNG